MAFTTDFSEELTEELAKVKNLIESTKPDKTSDETLKKLRNSFKKISETSFFPKFESNGGGCFVATAAYSSSNHPDLDTFRQFRDRTLLTNPLGRLVVSVYYQIGPQIAQYVNRSLSVKKIVRFLLEKLASFMRSRQIQ
ncbi:CFI-box-CTERM domain-containing protein [Phormidium pseudopriestleyi]|uniref:CFI-box-CTERM domain-containing protein n=1 Tax=Phormidium pseudopriestleyi TaxID=1759527 RepID=UPI001F5CD4B1|nr:CFI-box-CTERM domain-containing protein [Phormidium pseudopriestleyi]